MDRETPLKILVTAPLGVGGISNMMINIQKHLDRDKINFDYLVFHDRKEAMEEVVLNMGSNKYIASVDDVKFGFCRRILRINKIRKVCKANDIKILHYNADSPADLTNILGAKLGGVKFVTIHSHNAGYGTAGKGIKILSKILKPFMPKLCDNYWACSNLAAKFLFPKSIIEKKQYSVLPNGIELDKYDYNPQIRGELRKKMGIDKKFVIGHVGRFSDQKNHTFLLDIFKAVHQKESEAILLLFGVGELMEDMKKKAKFLGIDKYVIFYGASNEMEKMWQVMDVFVMPSLHEGLPVTGIEAQASGLPCIFSENITKEVDVSHKSQFLSLAADIDDWVTTILSHKDQERHSGKQLLKDAGYDIMQTTEDLSQFYLNLISKYEKESGLK